MRYRVEYKKRNSISTGSYVLFCLSYQHNSKQWQEKPTSLMEKIKESTIAQCVGAKAEDEKMRRIMITKATMSMISWLTKFSLIDLINFSFPTKVFQVNGKNRPVANLSVVDFHSQPRETPSPTLLNTNYLILRNMKALLFIHQPDRVARKASDVSGADWRYQTHAKRYRIFSRVLLRLFSGPEIPV